MVIEKADFPDYPPTLPNMIARVVTRFPQNSFLVEPERRATFLEVDERSSRLALGLLALGVGKASRVSIVMPNGIDWAECWWAAARIGAFTLPFSTFFRPRELGWGLAKGDVDTLLIHASYLNNNFIQRLEEAIPELAQQTAGKLFLRSHPYLRRIVVWGGGKPLLPDTAPAWALAGPDALLAAAAEDSRFDRDLLARVEAEVRPSDLLVGICTSGSTAEPKIVMHTHGSAIRLSHVLRQILQVRSNDRTYTGMPFFWLGGLNFNLLQCMFDGGAMVLSPTPRAEDVLDTLVRERVTRVTLWPAQTAALVEAARVRGIDLSFVERGLYPPKDAQGREIPLAHRCPGQLGMTESFGPHGMERPNTILPPEHRGSIGHPVEGIERRVVDPDTGRVLPPNEVGELQIRGFSMMDGYYKRERADVFLPDQWFATGDLVRLDEAGYVYFHSRHSEMIKTSGANVAPAEVEALLQTYADVQEAIVFGLPDEVKGERVAAVVVPKEGRSLDAQNLMARLRADLSAYKVPAELHVLPFADIPRTDAGKAKKGVLKERFVAGGTGA
jgi:acyl-CoA synthetase (AMP-forming)/AMP-acid ligase II